MRFESGLDFFYRHIYVFMPILEFKKKLFALGKSGELKKVFINPKSKWHIHKKRIRHQKHA